MIRSVFDPNNGVHIENQVGNVRFNALTRQPTYIMNESMGMRTVIGPDGKIHIERQVGNLRQDVTNGNTSWLL